MKKLTAYILLFCAVLQLLSLSAFADEGVSVSAKSCILTDEYGNVLYEKNADERSLIASVTKLMTAVIAAENLALDYIVTVKKEYTLVEGSSIYLSEGEKVSAAELLYGLLLESGNDAALALAYETAGNISSFSDKMNEKAKELGMDGTHFDNPHGLNSDTHYSTARDIAVLMRCAVKNELLLKIMSSASARVGKRLFHNHNKLLSSCEGVIAGKTGYTKKAGRTLATCCERDGIKLFCVTLSDSDDWNDHTSLYNWAYRNFDFISICDEKRAAATVPVVGSSQNTVYVFPKESFSIAVKKGKKFKTAIYTPKFCYAPVKSGSDAGRMDILADGKVLHSIELYYYPAVIAGTKKK